MIKGSKYESLCKINDQGSRFKGSTCESLCKINDQGSRLKGYTCEPLCKINNQGSRIKDQGLYSIRSTIKDQGSRATSIHASLYARSTINDQGSRFKGSTCESLWKINDQGSRGEGCDRHKKRTQTWMQPTQEGMEEVGRGVGSEDIRKEEWWNDQCGEKKEKPPTLK
jgi:hypothetical protein